MIITDGKIKDIPCNLKIQMELDRIIEIMETGYKQGELYEYVLTRRDLHKSINKWVDTPFKK